MYFLKPFADNGAVLKKLSSTLWKIEFRPLVLPSKLSICISLEVVITIVNIFRSAQGVLF
jgi:hypothetical protein